MEIVSIKTEKPSNLLKSEETPGKLKRKRQDISLEKKLSIIEAVDKGGRKKKDIAKEFEIPTTTLSSLLKYRDKILETRNSGTPLSLRKRVRGAKHSELDKELTEWYCQRRESNLSINGPILREKAEEIANNLGIIGFKCSNGWLQRMKARNQLIYGSKRPYRRSNEYITFIEAKEEEEEDEDDDEESEDNHKYHANESHDDDDEEEGLGEENCTKILISYEDYADEQQESKFQQNSHEEFLMDVELTSEEPDNTELLDRPQRAIPSKFDAFSSLDIIKQVIDSPDVEPTSEVLNSYKILHKFIEESYPQFVQLKINNFFKKLK